MIVEQVDMTPAMAKSLLAGNENNRHVSEKQIATMAAQMTAGQWVLNGETIVLSDTGRLLDGQHRLAAVIVAGNTRPGFCVPMLIVRGASNDAFATIDTGRTRKTADIVGMSGARHQFLMSAAAGNLYRMIAGVSLANPIPPQYIITLIGRFPSMDGWADRYRHGRGIRQISGGGTLIPMLTYLSDIAERPELAASLFDGLDRGQNLSSPDPILALRNRLIAIKSAKFAMSARTTWVSFVRAVDAMEAGVGCERIKSQITTAELQAPAKLFSHLARLPLMAAIPADFPPPPSLGKIRNQADIMRKLVDK